MTDLSTLDTHYAADDLAARVAAALHAAGLDGARVPWEALTPIDQLHVGGSGATTALASQLDIGASTTMLDVGCGMGGPARHLAATYGCTVTGIDVNRRYVDVATMLTERTGLSDRVRHRQADATDLPFPPHSFDIAWTQHVAMNIADRHALYAGIWRALASGGQLAIYDVLAGDKGPLLFPVPWAPRAELSFLLSESAQREVLADAGFAMNTWTDVTETGVRWIDEQTGPRRPGAVPPAISLRAVMGPDFPSMVANLGRNLKEGRARLVQMILRRVD